MTREISTSFEIKLTPAQTSEIEKMKNALMQIAANTSIPNHDPKHNALKPRKVEINAHINQEGDNLSIDIKAKTFCPQTKECFTYWDFNPETRQWEMPESLKALKEPRKPIRFNFRRMNFNDDDTSNT